MNRYEFVQRLHGLDLVKARKYLSKSVQYTMEERLKEIVQYHLKHNKLYASLIGNKAIKKFEDLPIIRKSDFQVPLESIISDDYKLKDLYVGNTSGSSGHPFFYAKNKESHAVVHAIIERLYSLHGLSVCDKQARFYGIPDSGLSRHIELTKDLLLNRVRFPIFDLSEGAMENFIRKFKGKKFVYIYGYTSAIVLLSKYILKKGYNFQDICPTIKACIVTSEVCTDMDRSTIEKALGVKVINEYGCSEAGMIAFEDQQGIWRLVEDDCYFEVVDNNGRLLPEGSEGRILITNLSNKALPFIRYEVGDVGIISSDNKGRYLKELSGRVSDIIKLPSGKIAGGLTFYYVSRSIMEENIYIKEFIVRQTSIDTFEFDIVSDIPLSRELEDTLLQKMNVYLEPGLKLRLNKVNHIIRPKSGKIKHFYSEIL